MDFFGNLSRSRRSQRGNYSEELKKYFSGAKSRNIRGEGGILDSQRMQLMPQLFLRWNQRYACATLALRLRLRLVGYHLYG